MHALEIKNLNKSFKVGFFNKNVPILKDVSFSLRAGRTTGFVGVNGSGKTTTLKCAMGFIHPDSGEVLFFGKALDTQAKKNIGYLPERPYLYDFLSGEEFLKLHWDISRVEKEALSFSEASAKAFERVNLSSAKNKKLRTYSKGMLQRIGIAQAIMTEPKFIIFDEPMSGLDPDGRFLVKEILKEEKERGATIFFSSHLLQDMEELCEDLIVMDQGRIVFSGLLSEFQKGQSGLEEAFEKYRRGSLT